MPEGKQLQNGKYHEELKWGSYFFIYSALCSFVFALFILALSNQAEDFYFTFSVLQFSVLLIFCITRAIKEKQSEMKLRFFAKLWMGVKVFGIYYSFWAIISGDQFLSSHSLLMRDNRYLFVRKEEELLPDNKDTLLNEFIKFFKVKKI